MRLKPIGGRTHTEVYDLQGVSRGIISCFLNLGNRSYLYIFKDQYDPLGVVAIDYKGDIYPQHVVIETQKSQICLSDPGQSIKLLKKIYKGARFAPLQEQMNYELVPLNELILKIHVGKIDRVIDSEVGHRIAIVNFQLEVLKL